MTQNSCCVPGCLVTRNDGIPLHRFPFPEKNQEKFNIWISNIGGKLTSMDNPNVYRNRRVCHRHFEEIYKYPKNRLNRLAIPVLFLPDQLPTESTMPSTSVSQETLLDLETRETDATVEHNYNNEQDDISNSSIEVGSSDAAEQLPSASTKAMEIDVQEELIHEGRLPQELISAISDGVPGLLVPPAVEPREAGLQWLQMLEALCESSETREYVMKEVSPDSFVHTLYSVLQDTSQMGPVDTEVAQQAVIVGCRTVLTLTPLSREWEAALNRLLAHHQVRKLLCAGLTSNNGARRIQVLQLVKHNYFPSDQMNQVFGESLHNVSDISAENISPRNETDSEVSWAAQRLTPAQEHAIDALITKLNDALHSDKGATDHMASLQHALALLQATNSSQRDALCTTQTHNEKLIKKIDELQKQLEDAEITLWDFRAKMAAERLVKENQTESLRKEFKTEIDHMETKMKRREKEAEERLKRAEVEYKALQKKLEEQTNKNGEPAGVFIKLKERVKQTDKKLKESAALYSVLRRKLEEKNNMIKQLEKTVVERESKLYQVITQLEEMKRV